MSNIEDAKKFIYSRNGNYFGTFIVDGNEFIRYTCEKGHQNSATLYVCYFRDWCQQCSLNRNKSAKQKIKGLLNMKEKKRETISYQIYKYPVETTENKKTKKKKKNATQKIEDESIPNPPPVFISPPAPVLPHNPAITTYPATIDSIYPPINLEELRHKRENLLNSNVNKRPSMFRKLTNPKKPSKEIPDGFKEKLAASISNNSEKTDI